MLAQTESGGVTATFKVWIDVDITGTVVVNGAAIPLNFTTPGQTARLAVSGSQNQQISIVSSNNLGM